METEDEKIKGFVQDYVSQVGAEAGDSNLGPLTPTLETWMTGGVQLSGSADSGVKGWITLHENTMANHSLYFQGKKKTLVQGKLVPCTITVFLQEPTT